MNRSLRVIPLRLLANAAQASLEGREDVEVRGLCLDSRRAAPGDLFVALAEDTAAVSHVGEAIERGAVAAIVSPTTGAALGTDSVPMLQVEHPRAVLGRISAAFYGNPGRELQLIGVTGTLGKTSTAVLIQAAYSSASGRRKLGLVGSLGASVTGRPDDSLPQFPGMTTPDAPDLHASLRALRDDGVRLVAMEVTSHALAQDRVQGLSYSLGVITNLVPDEHLEFHGTAESYLRTKARFLGYLRPEAPLVVNADDPLVMEMVSSRSAGPGALVCVTVQGADGGGQSRASRCDAIVGVRGIGWGSGGSRFTLEIPEQLPRLEGDAITEGHVRIDLPLLGVQHVQNAALAATAALVAGAAPADVASGLARVQPVPRRMEVVRAAGPCVIDDTTGNPEALHAVFTTIRSIPRAALRIVFGLRGSRGAEINARLAAVLAELVLERSQEEPVILVVTSCDDVSSARERVAPEERDAATAVLERALGLHSGAGDMVYRFEPELAPAVAAALVGVGSDDLVLLLGTQAMDEAGSVVRAWLHRHVGAADTSSR